MRLCFEIPIRQTPKRAVGAGRASRFDFSLFNLDAGARFIKSSVSSEKRSVKNSWFVKFMTMLWISKALLGLSISAIGLQLISCGEPPPFNAINNSADTSNDDDDDDEEEPAVPELSISPATVSNLPSFIACTRTITVTNIGNAASGALSKIETSDDNNMISTSIGCDGVSLDESGGASDSCTFSLSMTAGLGTDPLIQITITDGTVSAALTITVSSDPIFCPI